MKLKAFLAFLAVLAGATLARADLSIPITGGGGAPECTVAQLLAETGNCAKYAAPGQPDNGDTAIVTDGLNGSCETGGGVGSTARLPCIFRNGTWVNMFQDMTPWIAAVDAGGFGLSGLASLDFSSNLCTGLTNGRLTMNGAGLVSCVEDLDAAGSGQTWQNQGVSIPLRSQINVTSPTAAATDVGGTTTQLSIPSQSVAIANGANFVGTVFGCALPTPLSGTIPNCEAFVTSLNGTTIANGYLHLTGTFNVATPHTTTGGFKIASATLLPTCNGSAFECGDDFSNLATAVATLAGQYNAFTTASLGKPPIRLLNYVYGWDRTAYKLRGSKWTIDATANPEIQVVGNANNATTTITGTATITVGTDADRLTCASCGFFGTGTGYDGDEPLRPGDAFRLVSAGGWDAAGARVYYVTNIVDDDNLEFSPPATSDYSGSIEGGAAKVFDIDNTSTTSEFGATDVFGGVRILGNLTIACPGSACATVNPYTTPARTTPTYRGDVPLAGVYARVNAGDLDGLTVVGFNGRWDRSVVISKFNAIGSAVHHGRFSGFISPCGASNENMKYCRTGPDDTIATDDGLNTAVLVQTPNFEFDPIGLAGGGTLVYASGTNCGNMHVDARLAEGFKKIFYAPEGCQNVIINDISREQAMGCGGGGQPTCEAQATRGPLIEAGPWEYVSATVPATYQVNFNKVEHFGYAKDFIKITDTEPVNLIINGNHVGDTSKLLDISSNSIVVSGHVGCSPHASFSTACDKPAFGTYPDLIVTDVAGAVRYDTRSLATLSGLLPLAKLTDDNVNANRCLVSGGAGGDPQYIACPGGGATDLDSITDVSLTAVSDNQILRFNAGGGNWVNSPETFFSHATELLIAPSAPARSLMLGATAGAVNAVHLLSVDGTTVFNEQGADLDFRIESDTNPNMVYVDASTNRVGIGLAAPTVTFEVDGTSFADVVTAGILRPPTGTALPGTCTPPELFVDSDATSGQRLYLCESTNTWALQGDGGGGTGFGTIDVPAGTDPVAGTVLTITTSGTGITLTGDSGTDTIDITLAAAIQDLADGTLTVASGGTGAGTFTSGGLLFGQGTGALGALAVATNGQLPIGDGSGAPTLATLTGTANEIEITNGPGSVTIGIPTNPVLAGTATVGTQVAITSGCTLDTDLECPAHATAGGTLAAKEGADDGTARFVLKVPDAGLTGDADITHTLTAAGLIPSTAIGGGTASRCARFDGSGNLVAASGDCASGDTTGGSPTLDTVGDPAAASDLVFGATTETLLMQFTSAFTTGSQFLVQQTTGNPTGGVLFEARSGDNDVVAARFGDGTNYIEISSAGALTGGGTGSVAGGLLTADSVSWTSLIYSTAAADNVAMAAEECIFTTDGTGGSGGFLCEGTNGGNTAEQRFTFSAVADLSDTEFFIPLDNTAISSVDGNGLAIGSGAVNVVAGVGLVANADDLSIDYTQTLAGNPVIAAEGCVFTADGTGGGGFLCEGTAAGNSNEQLYLFPAVDDADTTSFIAVDATSITDLDGVGLSISGGALQFAGTELSSLTLGAGAFTTLTFDAGATDPVFTFGSDSWSVTGAATIDFPANSLSTADLATEKRSMYWGAGALSADGTDCANPAEVSIASGPKFYTVACAMASSETDGFLYGSTVLPDAINIAQDVTFEITARVVTDNAGATAHGYVEIQCVPADGTVGTTWSSGVDLDITQAAGDVADDLLQDESAAVDLAQGANPDCAGGDVLFWRWKLCDTDATPSTGCTSSAGAENDHQIVGFKMEYTTDIGD